MFLIALLTLFVCYIIYKFCKVASNSDDQKLEDELFLKMYRDKRKDEDKD